MPTLRLAGLEVGGVGLAEPGAELAAEDEAAQEMVWILPWGALGRDAEGRSGNGLVLEEAEGPEAGDAVPQERDWETVERDDCAVEDLSFSTRLVLGFAPPVVVVDEEEDEVTAQLSGMAPLLLVLPAGREG